MSASPLRLACLISGGGRTLMNLADRIDDGSLPARIELVISSRADAPGVRRACDRGFAVRVLPNVCGSDDTPAHDALTNWLAESRLDLICCCGYLRWIRIDPDWAGKVINIHPALLPKFGGKGMHGMAVHRAVLESGVAFSGCTVHYVDEHYDHGPIILQRVCPVLQEDSADSLAARVFEQECLAYPEAIRLIAAGKVKLENGRVVISAI